MREAMVMSASGDDRRERILHEVMAHGKATVTGLSELLGVTTETIRKDLVTLEERNVISKRHGFVTLATPMPERDYSEKGESLHLAEKTAIAERAARLTPQDAAVFLDTSTTVLCLASLLALRSDLTVITNSIDVCQALARSGSKILVTGGLYCTKSNSCVGSWALRSMESVNVDVAFLGCDGFSPEGPTIRSYQEVEFKRMVARRAKRTVLLADTSKLGNTGLYTFANYADFSLMIFERELNVGERKVLPKNVALIDVVPPS